MVGVVVLVVVVMVVVNAVLPFAVADFLIGIKAYNCIGGSIPRHCSVVNV